MTATRFSLGRIVATPGALEAMARNGTSGQGYLARHASGDWGDLDAEDKAANDDALNTEGRLFSAYLLADGTKIWVISEADRSSTCILLPEEYRHIRRRRDPSASKAPWIVGLSFRGQLADALDPLR